MEMVEMKIYMKKKKKIIISRLDQAKKIRDWRQDQINITVRLHCKKNQSAIMTTTFKNSSIKIKPKDPLGRRRNWYTTKCIEKSIKWNYSTNFPKSRER
jgi:hypothetical protein